MIITSVEDLQDTINRCVEVGSLCSMIWGIADVMDSIYEVSDEYIVVQGEDCCSGCGCELVEFAIPIEYLLMSNNEIVKLETDKCRIYQESETQESETYSWGDIRAQSRRGGIGIHTRLKI